MFNFGIEGYCPRWGNGLAEAARPQSLVGRKLTSVWLVWDLDDDEWFADCPVLLDFAGEQIEINHQKFDDLSITWNSADPTQSIIWPTEDFHLTWRNDTRDDLTALYGQTVQEVDLLEWAGDLGDMANGAIAVDFSFESGHLCVFNALDENGLHIGPRDSRWRRHSAVR